MSSESQLLSAAPFHVGQIVAERTDCGKTRKLYKIESLYIVDTKAEGQMLAAEHLSHTSRQPESRPSSSHKPSSKGSEYGTGKIPFNPDPLDPNIFGPGSLSGDVRDDRHEAPELTPRARPPNGGQRYVSMVGVTYDFDRTTDRRRVSSRQPGTFKFSISGYGKVMASLAGKVIPRGNLGHGADVSRKKKENV